MSASIGSWIAGALTAVVSMLIGAWFTAKWNFRYQQKLLDQQLEFQKQSQEEIERFIKRIMEELSRSLTTIARRSPGGIGHPDTNPARSAKK